MDEIKRLLDKFFSDTSRSKEETRGELENLRDEIDILLDCLDEM